MRCFPECVVGSEALWDVSRQHMTKGTHVEINMEILCNKVLLPYSVTPSPELLNDVSLLDRKIMVFPYIAQIFFSYNVY